MSEEGYEPGTTLYRVSTDHDLPMLFVYKVLPDGQYAKIEPLNPTRALTQPMDTAQTSQLYPTHYAAFRAAEAQIALKEHDPKRRKLRIEALLILEAHLAEKEAKHYIDPGEMVEVRAEPATTRRYPIGSKRYWARMLTSGGKPSVEEWTVTGCHRHSNAAITTITAERDGKDGWTESRLFYEHIWRSEYAPFRREAIDNALAELEYMVEEGLDAQKTLDGYNKEEDSHE